MKSPKEDYEIRKLVVSDPGTREDLLIFLTSSLLVRSPPYHVGVTTLEVHFLLLDINK